MDNLNKMIGEALQTISAFLPDDEDRIVENYITKANKKALLLIADKIKGSITDVKCHSELIRIQQELLKKDGK